MVAVPVGLRHCYRLRGVELLAHFGSELDGLDRRGRDDVCGARPERAVVGEEVDEDVVVAMFHGHNSVLWVTYSVVGLSVGRRHGRVVAVVLGSVGNELVKGIGQPIAVRFVCKELTAGVGVVMTFFVCLQDVPQHLLVAGECPGNERAIVVLARVVAVAPADRALADDAAVAVAADSGIGVIGLPLGVGQRHVKDVCITR